MRESYDDTFEFISNISNETLIGVVFGQGISKQVVYALEDFASVINDIRPLLEKHWDEVALNKENIKLDPDYEKYKLIEKSGKLRIFTARINSKLVGYIVLFVGPHIHYKTKIWALSDIFWISPEIRGISIGSGLFKMVMRSLKKEGVHVLRITSKTAHPKAAIILEQNGFDHIEVGHAILLNGD